MSHQPASLYDAIDHEMRGTTQYKTVGRHRPPEDVDDPEPDVEDDDADAPEIEAAPPKREPRSAPITPTPAVKKVVAAVEEEGITVILHGKWGKAKMTAVEVVGSTTHANGLLHLLVHPAAIAYFPAFIVDGEIVKITMEFPDDDRDNEDVVCIGDPVRLHSLGLDIITYVPYALFGMEKDGSINDNTPPDVDGKKDEDVTITKAAAQDFDKPRK